MTETYEQIKQQRDEARAALEECQILLHSACDERDRSTAACAEMRLVIQYFAEAHDASAERMIENALSSNYGKDLLLALENAGRTANELMRVLGMQCLPCQLPRFFEDKLTNLQSELERKTKALVSLINFTTGLCQDVGLSTNYPSLKSAREALNPQTK